MAQDIPTPIPPVSDVPVVEVVTDVDDAYIATLDRLATMIEYLIGFIPVGMLGTAAVALVLITGALFVVSRLTPTKRDDEIFERIWTKTLELFERIRTDGQR